MLLVLLARWVKPTRKQKGSAKITDTGSIKEPGDLIHVDQAESTNPGRPLTHSGRNSAKKIHGVTIFVDTISKKVMLDSSKALEQKKLLLLKERLK